ITMQSFQRPRKIHHALYRWLCVAALGTAPVLLPAQGAADSGAEEVVVLSPFTVEESGDTGYLAQNSLAGSRLNSRLKDVASPVSVFTSEFISDIAVTNLEELLEYAPNISLDREEAVNGGDTTGSTLNEPF